MKTRWVAGVLIFSMVIAYYWDRSPAISGFFHSILDPVFNPLLNWNIFWGMVVIVLFISVIMTFVQKYATDQKEMGEIKKRQKEIQKEMKEYKEHPDKIMALNKEQFSFMGKMMKLSMGAIVYTAIPFILIFRWLMDYFAVVDYAFLGFMSWFWFYLLASVVFSSILRKAFKVA